jgi:hypothetical protein
MKNLLSICAAVTSVCVLFGCQKFQDGVVHEVDFPPHVPRPAVSLIASSTDLQIEAVVSVSAGILDNDGPRLVHDAVLTLTGVGTDPIVLSESHFDPFAERYVYPLSAPLGLTGAVTLTAEVPDFETLTATQTMRPPASVGIEFDIADTTSIDSKEMILPFQAAFENVSGQDDFYLVRVYVRFPDSPFATEEVQIYFSSLDHRTEDLGWSKSVLVRDEGLDGVLDIQFEAEYWPEEGYEPEFYLRVQSLTPDLYLYYRSISAFLETEGNPFAEPVLTHSNIDGGFGCFGLASEVVIPFE